MARKKKVEEQVEEPVDDRELSPDHIPWTAEHTQVVVYARVLNSRMRERMSAQARLRDLKKKGFDNNPVGDLILADLRNDIAHLMASEDRLSLELRRGMRRHPLSTFIKLAPALGLPSIGRLLGYIGHPANDRPRCKMLLNYCGMMVDEDGKAVKREKGVKSNWSNGAKSLAFVIGLTAIKQRCAPCTEQSEATAMEMRRDKFNQMQADGEIPDEIVFEQVVEQWLASSETKSKRKWPKGIDLKVTPPWQQPPHNCSCWADRRVYRTIYDNARVKDLSLDTSEAHKHNRAVRAVARQILIDLWIASRWAAKMPAYGSPTMLWLYGDKVPMDLHERGQEMMGQTVAPSIAVAAD